MRRRKGVGLASAVGTNLQVSAYDVTAAYGPKQRGVPLFICRLFEATFNVDSVSLNFAFAQVMQRVGSHDECGPDGVLIGHVVLT